MNLTPFRFLLGNPIPFIPFPLIRGRGISYIREASPPFDPPFKERGNRFLNNLSIATLTKLLIRNRILQKGREGQIK